MSISSVIGVTRTIDELGSLMIAFRKVGGAWGKTEERKAWPKYDYAGSYREVLHSSSLVS